MGSRPTKPNVQSVVDLGLRDVGVENDPRRPAAYVGKSLIRVLPLIVVGGFATCAIIGLTRAGAWIVPPLALAWTAGVFALAFRIAKRSPQISVKVTAEGTNQVPWIVIASFLLLALAAALTRSVLFVPPVVLAGMTALGAWRGRGRVPEVLRELRALLAADESVLGDGVGLVRGERRWSEAFRLVVATDRRLLVTAPPRSSKPFPLVDVPYGRISRFGIEWKYWGRMGVLSLTVDELGEAPRTHVITSIAPANLLSIARVLRSHGVDEDDPAALSELERAWEDAQRGEPRRRLLDRTAMSTPEFDQGLWLLLAVSAVAFYANPFGVGFGTGRDADVAALVVLPALCGVCGYVSSTKASLAYLAPLNLLVAPAFFFLPASYVISLMIMVSAIGAAGLWAGSALRRAKGRRDAAPPARPPDRRSLRHALSGLGLVRITTVMLVWLIGLVAVSSAAGFELTSLRLAIDELTVKQVPVDGRSNLTGGAASVRYTRGPGLHELITDNAPAADPTDGARWELRSSFTKGYNVVSLAHYTYERPLDDPAAVADFVRRKDSEHARLAGSPVTHTERTVHGRKGYVWSHGSRWGYWYYAAWFPHPAHTVRVECIAKREKDRFKRLCAEAVSSLEFHR